MRKCDNLPSAAKRKLQSDQADGGDCCASCNSESSLASSADPGSLTSLRILTWSGAEPALRAYAASYRESNPDSPTIHIYALPSLKRLNIEAEHDLRLKSGLYDGFVVPPLLLGDMHEQDGGLALWDDASIGGNAVFNDLLPFYRYSIATFDGAVRSLPLFSGSQQLILYRKDYLDSMGLPTPKTWSEWVRIASKLHHSPIGPNRTKIYGACMGRLSQEGCRKKNELSSGKYDGALCNSQSMTYLGMMLSSMTQVGGNSTGWMLGIDPGSPSGLQPLFVPTIERILFVMEQQLRFGSPNELMEDSSLNLRLFEQGLCGMTVTAHHPSSLLNESNVGFVPLPGSQKFLVRARQELIDCSESLCPHGTDSKGGGRVNLVPFGTIDSPVGAVSAHVARPRQDAAKLFFEFVMAESTLDADKSSNATITREQPMTYSQLKRSGVAGYEAIITGTTSNENGAIPFRVPNAFNLYSELDDKVYDYLVAGNYTEANRQRVGQSLQTSWQQMIQMRDHQGHVTMPTATFYETSLGTFSSQVSEDLYIEDVSRIIGWSLGGLGCLISLLMAVLVWKYQDERVVRASQPMFLWMLCAGTLIMASSIFPFGLDDAVASYQASSIACMSGLWLFCLGFVATFSALFSKIWIIIGIFRRSRNQQRIQVTRKDLLLPFLMLFGVNFAVLLVWTIVDPPHWERVPVYSADGSLEGTYGWCQSENSRVYLGIILGINFVMMMIAIIQAYECRRITTEYSESLWISGSIATIAQVWIIGLPILRLVEDNPNAAFLTKVGVIFGSSISTLVLIFGPKLDYLRDSLEAKSEAAKVSKGQQGSRCGGKDMKEGQHPSSDTQSQSDGELDDDNDDGRPPNGAGAKGNMTVPGAVHRTPRGVVGIRIIPTTVLHGDEVDRLQTAVERAELRNKSLQTSLEKLQEKLEHYIIARDPLGSNSAAVATATAAAGNGNSGGPSYSANGRDRPNNPHHPGGPRSRNGMGSNSILAARPEGMIRPSTIQHEQSLPFEE